MSTTTTTVAGTWRAAHTIDLEAQTVLVHGRREHAPLPLLPLPLPAYAHASSDALVLQVGASDSRHDDRRASLILHDAPPPYTPNESTDALTSGACALPSYASVAEPPTLAMRLFQLGFLLPLLWPLGALILLTPLRAPLEWEHTKPAAERAALLACLRRAEVKWARRCLTACAVFVLVLAALVLLAVFARRA